jgi:hypothetical protein
MEIVNMIYFATGFGVGVAATVIGIALNQMYEQILSGRDYK